MSDDDTVGIIQDRGLEYLSWVNKAIHRAVSLQFAKYR